METQLLGSRSDLNGRSEFAGSGSSAAAPVALPAPAPPAPSLEYLRPPISMGRMLAKRVLLAAHVATG